ncbi:MAG: type IV pilus secretin PilQ [Thermodesulfovibrio sp.]
MINKVMVFLFFIIVFFTSNLMANELKTTFTELKNNEIKAVIFEGDILKIHLSEKADYRLVSQEDPFKIKIELKNTAPGVLNKKIFFREGIVSEISAQVHRNNTVLDILLVEPLKYEVKMEKNFLIVSFMSSNDSLFEQIKAERIIEILVDETEDGFKISIYGDGELPEPSISKFDDYINVSFSGITLDAELPKEIPVSVSKIADELVLSFLYAKEFDIKAVYLGDEVILDIKRIKETKISKAQEKNNIEKSIQNAVNEERTISLDLQDADLVGVFRLLGDIGGYNIVIHPDVKGKVTLKLINVSWKQAFDVICKTFQLEKSIEGNIIRVAPIKVFQEEKKLEAEIKDLLKKAEDEQFRIFVLKHASADKVKGTIEGAKILSPKGTISIDERTRAVIVKDIPSVLDQIATIVENLDKPTRQILLETRIIEISSSFSKSLGFEWGIRWSPADTRTTIVGSVAGQLEGAVLGGRAPLAINLPASTGNVTAPTSAFTIGYLNPSQTFALDLRISALQQSGKGKVISNPKVITLDNQKAKIVQGASIPYGEKDVQSGQISTKFRDVAIIVEVIPHLIDDKSMLLDLSVIKEDLVEFINIGGVYAPRTTKIEGNTKVFLRDGETIVIGGIYKKTDTMTESKVPGIGDIPIIGELFKSRGRDESLYEVMIFVTPRILRYD